jgi:hypothetical protein
MSSSSSPPLKLVPSVEALRRQIEASLSTYAWAALQYGKAQASEHALGTQYATLFRPLLANGSSSDLAIYAVVGAYVSQAHTVFGCGAALSTVLKHGCVQDAPVMAALSSLFTLLHDATDDARGPLALASADAVGHQLNTLGRLFLGMLEAAAAAQRLRVTMLALPKVVDGIARGFLQAPSAESTWEAVAELTVSETNAALFVTARAFAATDAVAALRAACTATE